MVSSTTIGKQLRDNNYGFLYNDPNVSDHIWLNGLGHANVVASRQPGAFVV